MLVPLRLEEQCCGVHAGGVGLLSVQSGSALSREEIPQGIVVVLIKSGVYERVKEGVGVS